MCKLDCVVSLYCLIVTIGHLDCSVLFISDTCAFLALERNQEPGNKTRVSFALMRVRVSRTRVCRFYKTKNVYETLNVQQQTVLVWVLFYQREKSRVLCFFLSAS